MSTEFLKFASWQACLAWVYQHEAYAQLLAAPQYLLQFGEQPQLLMAYAFSALQTQHWKTALDYLRRAERAGYQPPADLLYFRAWAYEELGEQAQALALYQELHALPNLGLELLRDLGRALIRLKVWEQAQVAWQRCIQQSGAEVQDFLVLGALYQEKGYYRQQAAVYQQAREQGLVHWQLGHRLAQALKMAGEITEALKIYRQLLNELPKTLSLLESGRIFSEYLLCLYFDPQTQPEGLSQLFKQWRKNYEPNVLPLHSQPLPKAVLKVGFLSSDFRQTSVARLLLWLWENPPEHLVFYVYDGAPQPDAMTAHFRTLTPHWRGVATWDMQAVIAQIHQDAIDVLVDISGHTSLSYLPIFAQKPAPLQITGLGFNGPTGLSAMNYRFTDQICTPAAQRAWEEPPLYLRSWIYWRPPDTSVPIVYDAKRPIRLGSTHHLGKLNAEVQAVWAEILNRCPDAELHLKQKALAEPATVKAVQQSFSDLGVEPERIFCWPASGYQDYLAFYNQVDVFLDTFPCHGGITTCEALWMGIPVVTLDSWMRGGVSLLTQVGLEDLIARDYSEYVKKVLDILEHPWNQAQREALRSRFLAAPVADGAGFAKEFEQVVWQAWHSLHALP